MERWILAANTSITVMLSCRPKLASDTLSRGLRGSPLAHKHHQSVQLPPEQLMTIDGATVLLLVPWRVNVCRRFEEAVVNMQRSALRCRFR